MELINLNRPVVSAEANWGRWIVRCLICADALKLAPRTPLFQCWTCGLEAEVLWPVNTAAIERLLMMRPLEQTRNWLPGETLTDLLEENVLHGVGLTQPGDEIQIVGDRIITDTLPASRALRQIGA